MTLMWHMVRKDLFRLRWILLLWALVIVGSMAMAIIQARLDTETYLPFFVAAVIGAWGFWLVIAFGLVMGVMHDDPVADGDAFWITRPISGGQLLAAKGIVLALLWCVPLVVLVPFWLGHGFGLGNMATAAWFSLRAHLIVGALAIPLAVLSASGSRFVINFLIAAGVLAILAVLFQLGDNGPSGLSAGLKLTRVELVAALWLLTAGAVTWMQFFRRRTHVSLIIVGFAAVLGFGLMKWWPVDYHPPGTAQTAPVAMPALALDSATVENDRAENAAGDQAVRVTFKVDGLPEGAVAHVLKGSHRLEWPDGMVTHATSTGNLEELAGAAWRQALGEKTAATVSTQFGIGTPNQIPERLRRDRPAYSANVEGEFRQLAVVSEVPVAVKAKSYRNGEGLLIVDFLLDIGTGEFGISHSETSSEADAPPAFYFLVNRQDGRSVLGRSARVGQVLAAGGIHFTHLKLSFGARRNWRGGPPADFDAFRTWARSAVLVKVVAREAGTFRSTMAAPNLRVEAPAAPTPRSTANSHP